MICILHDAPVEGCDDCKAESRPVEPCPKCGAPKMFGYGLMGGGMGGYVLCENDDCDFFEKRQDEDLSDGGGPTP